LTAEADSFLASPTNFVLLSKYTHFGAAAIKIFVGFS
jgi:hypothetical protein